MAWYRCSGGGGGSAVMPSFSGIFGTDSGLIIKNGKWLSGFGNNKLYFPRKIDGTGVLYDDTKKRHIHLRFKLTGNISTDSQGILGTTGTTDRYAPQINVYPQNNTNFCVIGWSSDGSTNTTWLTFAKSSIPYDTSKEYTIDAVWDNGTLTGTVSDGTNTETKTATDGNQYIDSANKDKIAIGIRKYNNIYATNIAVDLTDSYWEEDDVILWGNKAE